MDRPRRRARRRLLPAAAVAVLALSSAAVGAGAASADDAPPPSPRVVVRGGDLRLAVPRAVLDTYDAGREPGAQILTFTLLLPELTPATAAARATRGREPGFQQHVLRAGVLGPWHGGSQTYEERVEYITRGGRPAPRHEPDRRRACSRSSTASRPTR